tara:strand:+ start:3619 stop:4167 length:549 start_codon:yes stop_codon:yes gene_type:complete
MSLKHVILVVLKKGQCTGYEINQTFAGPLGIYWHTTHQAVYRALASLSREGWVRYREKSQDGKPDKKIYSITASGERALNQWLREHQQPGPINESLLVKFFAGELCPTGALIEQVRELQATHQRNLEYYRSLAEGFEPGLERQGIDTRRGYLTQRRGILMEQARLAWCDEALAMLEQDQARE